MSNDCEKAVSHQVFWKLVERGLFLHTLLMVGVVNTDDSSESKWCDMVVRFVFLSMSPIQCLFRDRQDIFLSSLKCLLHKLCCLTPFRCLLGRHLRAVFLTPLCKIAACSHYLSSVQSLSRVRFFATPWTAAHQVPLSITNSWSLPNSCPSHYLLLLYFPL